MNFRRIVTLAILMTLCASLALGQAQPPGPGQRRPPRPNRPAMQNRNPNEPRPSPELKRLAVNVLGMWRAEEQHEAMGPTPAGSSTGTAVFRLGPGGLSIIENFRVRGDLGQVTGLGIVSWDPKAQLFKAYWCDNLTPSGCEPMGTGKWDGDKLVMTSETEEGGKKLSVRETYSGFTADSFTWTMESGGPGGKLAPMMTVKYTRDESAPAPPAAPPPPR
jgi:hypothetical protein